jgi:hypothetical protein
MLPLALDAVVSLGGLIAPPLFDFVKKKFIKSENDTPERTIGTLATTNPEAVPGYVSALAEHLKAKTQFFNRDVIGQPSQWVIDLRASIRPITVAAGLFYFGLCLFVDEVKADPSVKVFLEVNISSWFGSRFVSSK